MPQLGAMYQSILVTDMQACSCSPDYATSGLVVKLSLEITTLIVMTNPPVPVVFSFSL